MEEVAKSLLIVRRKLTAEEARDSGAEEEEEEVAIEFGVDLVVIGQRGSLEESYRGRVKHSKTPLINHEIQMLLALLPFFAVTA